MPANTHSRELWDRKGAKDEKMGVNNVFMQVYCSHKKKTGVIYSPTAVNTSSKKQTVNNSRTRLWRHHVCQLKHKSFQKHKNDICIEIQSEISKLIHIKCRNVCVCGTRLHHAPGLSLHVLFLLFSAFQLFILPLWWCPRVSHEAWYLSSSLLSSLLDQLLLPSAPSPEDDFCFPAHPP